MSLSSPLWLLALIAIPAVLLAQRAARERARRYALRFPAAATAELASSTAARWQRWVPAALLLAGFAAGVIALTGPRVTRRIAVGNASIMLVLDHSGSMAADDVQPTRIQAAIRAANSFIDQLPSSVKVGAVAFSTTPDTVQVPVLDHAAARAVIDSQVANGGTATGPALQTALQALHGGVRGHAPAAIVLLSDGAANLGVDPVTVAQQARADGIAIDTVALGTPNGVLDTGPFTPPLAVPPDPTLMRQIAAASGGRSFDAQTADELSSIYQTLGRHLGSVERTRDVTWVFALIAGALVLVAVAASVRTSTRLP